MEQSKPMVLNQGREPLIAVQHWLFDQ